jgi:hypothetical protein
VSGRRPMRAGSGGVRCTECGAHAAADGTGRPIVLHHAPSCPEDPANLPDPDGSNTLPIPEHYFRDPAPTLYQDELEGPPPMDPNI